MAIAVKTTQQNVFSRFLGAAAKHAQRIAFKADGGRGQAYTYTEVADLASGVATGLGGPQFDDQPDIGLLSENRPEWAIAYLAIIAAGKTVVPIDANLKNNEIAWIINHAGLRTVIASDKFQDNLSGISSDLQIFSFAPDSENYWLQLSSDGDTPPAAGPDTPAVLIYTSGTTGIPKAVELTHRNLTANLDGIRGALVFNQDDVFLSVLPLHHTFEATCGFLAPITSGSTIIYARSLKSRDILDGIALNKVTVMTGVPLLFEKMYHKLRRGIADAPAHRRALYRSLWTVAGLGWKLGAEETGRRLFGSLRERAGLGTIRMFVSGGAPLPAEISRFFNYLGFNLMQGYGLTECSPVVAVNLPGDIRFGSVGPPLKNLEIKIDNPNPAGIGEILVRGDSTTPGYRGNKEATEELYSGDWLCTGDVGTLKDGHLWITGRQKNVIISAAGKNVYPEELEERLVTSLYVMEAVVLGRRKEGKQGEDVFAVIVPDIDQFKAEFGMLPEQPDMKKIREVLGGVIREVNGQVADYKRIDAFEVQLEELEKTSTKKVKRFRYK